MNSADKEDNNQELLTHQEWESEHFGMKMGRVSRDFSRASSQSEALRFIEAIVHESNEKEMQHITLEITQDKAHLDATLRLMGFKLVDKKLKYTATPQETPKRAGYFKIRDFQESDRGEVTDIIRKTHLPSRFSNDPILPKEKVHELYVKWMEKLEQERARGGILIVGTRHNKIVGCGGLSPEKENPYSLGNSLLTCSPDGIGAGYSIVAHGINEGTRRFLEVNFSTSSENTKMIRILEALGCKRTKVSLVYSRYQL